MELQQIQSAISGLTKAELERFENWYEEFLAAKWDKQIEVDAASGKLDRLAKSALEEYDSGRAKPL